VNIQTVHCCCQFLGSYTDCAIDIRFPLWDHADFRLKLQFAPSECSARPPGNRWRAASTGVRGGMLLPGNILWSEAINEKILLGMRCPDCLNLTRLHLRFRVHFLSCDLLNDVVSSDFIASIDRMINERWIGKDMEGSDRGIIWCIMPAFACRGCGRPQKTSVRITGLQAEIWTRTFPNTKPDFRRRSDNHSTATFGFEISIFTERATSDLKLLRWVKHDYCGNLGLCSTQVLLLYGRKDRVGQF
jgi:hypothetical protein